MDKSPQDVAYELTRSMFSKVIVCKKCTCCGARATFGAPRCHVCQHTEFSPIEQVTISATKYSRGE